MQHYDVVIIGGGLVGTSAALAIYKAKPELKIAVVEAFATPEKLPPSFDDRCIAFSQQSVEYMQSLGLFDTQWSFNQAIQKVHVSDRGHFGKTSLNHKDYDREALGYVVEVNPYGAFLHDRLHTTSVTLYNPAKVEQLQQTKNSVSLTLDIGKKIDTKLLVVADGAFSPTRDLLNLSFQPTAYTQGAITANVSVAEQHKGHAFERFTEHGPMALLPMNNNRYSLAWCMDKQKLDEYQGMSEEAFIAALQSAFGYRAGKFTQVGQRSQYPLLFGRVEKVAHHRAVIIGNAAHTIHPIAGQGFNLGLRDIQSLVEIIQKTPNSALGEYAFTREYELNREDDINTIMTLTDSLVRLFSNSSRIVAFGRSCGLLAMTLSRRLKAPLAKTLMGQKNQY